MRINRIAKILACLLILLSVASSAPINQSQNQQLGKNKPVKKNNGNPPKMFSKQDYEAWTNPCTADGYASTGSNSLVDREEAYQKSSLYSQIKLTIAAVKEDLNNHDKINTSNYEAFDFFNANSYAFLPNKPTNNHRKWHFDLQVYVATFGVLYKEQLKQDVETNNNTLSTELHAIFNSARELLCAIEDFVNATNTERIGSQDWLTRHEMKQLLNFKNLTDKLTIHRMYAKGRFQTYIKKLHDRIIGQITNSSIQNQSQSKYPKLRALKKNSTTRRKRKQLQNGVATKKIHKIRTTKNPKSFAKKRKNQRQQRSTTISPVRA